MSAILLGFAVLVGPSMTSQQAAFAQTPPEDINGIELKQPYGSYTLTYTGQPQWFSTSGSFDENFRTDGSMRMEWIGTYSPSLMMAGYFKLSPDSCTNFPNEEISAKMNGGPHTGSPTDANFGSTTEPNADWADTMDLGGIAFDGSGAGPNNSNRVRFEDPHPTGYGFSWATATNLGTITNPLATDLCSTPDGWVGVMAFKTNIDNDCSGTPERWQIRNYVDISGLNTDGSPKNNWQMTYARTFIPTQLVPGGGGDTIIPDEIKKWKEPYVRSIGHPEATYQTWRIDNQNYDDWTDADPNYKFITLKRTVVTTNACGSGLASESALVSDEEGTATVVSPDSTEGSLLSTEEQEQQQEEESEEQEVIEEEEESLESNTPNTEIDEEEEGDNDDEE